MQASIYTTDGTQIQQIPAGTKLACVRYVIQNPISVQTPIGAAQDIAGFPALGFSRIAIQLEPTYARASTGIGQIYFEIRKYRDGGSPIMLSAGSLSPPNDKLDDEYSIMCNSIGLRLGTADFLFAGVLPPIVLVTYSVVLYP